MGSGSSTPRQKEAKPKTKSKSFRFHYFDGKGRGEVVRLAFVLAGLDFDDVRHTAEEWANMKQTGEFTGPFRQLPWLELEDGTTISQTRAILRLVAREGGFDGDTNLDAAKADEITDAVEDIKDAFFTTIFEQDEQKKASLEDEFWDSRLPTRLRQFEKLLEMNNGGQGFFVGKAMTHADLEMFSLLDMLESSSKERDLLGMLGAVPLVKAHKERVSNHPKIAEYIKTRRDTPL
ncbi:PREDICTED: S-crystallin SL11-like [Branchiostoma belcheri]|uniref:glutathione transferase n=1 Tax=Branchiostoma belcheri TaxID=7741 RepID=A0A6P4ZYC8_BRABE|nr:PREDICTED: S-crystallin SL11-like [Branchiostoma belcheri]